MKKLIDIFNDFYFKIWLKLSRNRDLFKYLNNKTQSSLISSSLVSVQPLGFPVYYPIYYTPTYHSSQFTISEDLVTFDYNYDPKIDPEIESILDIYTSKEYNKRFEPKDSAIDRFPYPEN